MGGHRRQQRAGGVGVGIQQDVIGLGARGVSAWTTARTIFFEPRDQVGRRARGWMARLPEESRVDLQYEFIMTKTPNPKAPDPAELAN